MTDWPRGGYPAGNTPASELKPPPDSMISKSSLPATYTAAEVKVLTEAASKVAYALGRKDAGEEIAEGIEAVRDSVGKFPIENLDDLMTSHQAWTNAAQIARDVGSEPPEDATSERTDPSMDSDLSPEPQAAREAP